MLTDKARQEYIRQWASLSWFTAWGIIVFLFGLLGLVYLPLSVGSLFGVGMFAYAIIQKQALRRKVAEAGEDPDALARFGQDAFNHSFWRFIGILAIICFALVLLVTALAFLDKRRAKEADQAPPETYQQSGSQTGYSQPQSGYRSAEDIYRDMPPSQQRRASGGY